MQSPARNVRTTAVDRLGLSERPTGRPLGPVITAALHVAGVTSASTIVIAQAALV